MNQGLKIATLILSITIVAYACQNKKAAKTMSNENINNQPADSDRLLSVANLEQTDSGRKVIAWFFETPQVFEFKMGSEQSLLIYKLLKDAKEKQIPVNVRSIAEGGKNIIENVLPATNAQIKEYNKEKAQRQQPIKMNEPPHN
jgi:hypothetical protein